MYGQEVVQQLSTTREFLNEVEKTGNYEGIESFFMTEEKMLNHLYRLEKKEAQQLIREMIDTISKRSQDDELKGVKYYLITLSSMIARYLDKALLGPRKAYAFNVTCIMLIEAKLNEENRYEIADELIELYTYVLAERKRPSLLHNTVNNVILYINNEVESPLTVEDIAKKFNVSTSHLSRIFREHTGITLVEFINIRKVEESQYYLRFSDKRISHISDQFHFCNQSYFTRIFKKYTGETPRRFRADLTREYFRFVLPGEEKLQIDSQSL